MNIPAFLTRLFTGTSSNAELLKPSTEPARTKSEPYLPPIGTIYPSELADGERARVTHRRNVLGVDSATPAQQPVGIALSGGGIRSATFCLGVLQSLAGNGLWSRIDFLSTVSGGGYAGSAVGRMYERLQPGQSVEDVSAAIGNSDSEFIRWLRENGRYISPNGSGDVWQIFGVLFRNVFAIHVFIGLLLVVVFAAADFLRHGLAATSQARTILVMLPDRLQALLAFPTRPSWEWSFWWSPYWLVPLALFVFVVFPLAASHWLTSGADRPSGGKKGGGFVIWIYQHETIVIWALFLFLLLVSTISILLRSIYHQLGYGLRGLIVILAITSWAALLSFLAAVLVPSANETSAETKDVDWRPRVRNHLSAWLGGATFLFVVSLCFAFVDSIGQSLYRLLADGSWHPLAALSTGGGLGVLAVLGQKVFAIASARHTDVKPRGHLLLSVATDLFGILAVFALLLFWNIIVHAAWWNGHEPDALGKNHSVAALGIAGMASLIITILSGRIFSFLNLSSHHGLYAARLTRAYLGASNPKRQGEQGTGVSEVLATDDLPFKDYRPDERGGPLHLINVTLNETVDGKSQVEQRDRKGLPIVFGPSGVSVGNQRHALWNPPSSAPPTLTPVVWPERLKVGTAIEPEVLSLGTLVAISGAAFSTGLGAATRTSYAILAGLFNVRLGYWWYSGIASPPPHLRPSLWLWRQFSLALPTHAHIIDELLARFHGTIPHHWYLTDGGHFENTALYELIRRRVPFIICCDCGQDERYEFLDVANLVRKARLDFSAHISFLTKDEIESGVHEDLIEVIVPYEELRPGRKTKDLLQRPSKGHAALARVRYEDTGQESLILWIKPTLTGDEPIDLLQFKIASPQFPNDTTLNQFFNEAQWESYRKLGEHIGELLFKKPSETSAAEWSPYEELTKDWCERKLREPDAHTG